MEFALTKDWEATEFDADDAYVRGFMDNVFVYPDRLCIHEYKTGQEYDDHADQKALYAMIAMLLFPDHNSVEIKGMYIDKQKEVVNTYSRALLHSMKYHWKREIDKLSVPIYPTRPGGHCRWCPKSNKGGGPCPLG
jgi:hypothetical protein